VRRHCQMLVSISGAVRLKNKRKVWRMNFMSAGRGLPYQARTATASSGEQVDNCPRGVSNTEHQ